jgi:hypothetical protein
LTVIRDPGRRRARAGFEADGDEVVFIIPRVRGRLELIMVEPNTEVIPLLIKAHRNLVIGFARQRVGLLGRSFRDTPPSLFEVVSAI